MIDRCLRLLPWRYPARELPENRAQRRELAAVARAALVSLSGHAVGHKVDTAAHGFWMCPKYPEVPLGQAAEPCVPSASPPLFQNGMRRMLLIQDWT